MTNMGELLEFTSSLSSVSSGSASIAEISGHDNMSTDTTTTTTATANSDHDHTNLATTQTTDANKRMFFTTSDLIERMNSAVHTCNTKYPHGGFELQTKLPDGSYRRAEPKEIAAVDFQTKMKQASEIIAGLNNSQQKIEWAQRQRVQGNALFAEGEYMEAMDVYLTCLVAIDPTQAAKQSKPHTTLCSSLDSNNNGSDASEKRILEELIERDIKLPVLLNLAMCSMKLGFFSKAEKFCNFAMETDLGRQSPKAYFRRGRARMMMGKYSTAESDLNHSLNLLRASTVNNNNQGASSGEIISKSPSFINIKDEERVILREIQKLRNLVRRAHKNVKHQKMAMEQLFQSNAKVRGKVDTKEEIERDHVSLYHDKQERRQRHTELFEHTCCVVRNADKELESDCSAAQHYFKWYLAMFGRCARKILDAIGDDETNENFVVPADQDLFNRLMDLKKIS